MFLYSYQQNDPESDRVHGAEVEREEDGASWAPPGRLLSELTTATLPGPLYGRGITHAT